MKILIAGATGFIGKKLGSELALSGHQLHVLTRSAKGLRENLPFPCRIFEWNPESNKIPLTALDGVDAVINLAGTPVASKRWSDKVKESILTSRLMSTECLWAAIQKSQDHNVHTFINASAIGYYGNSGDQIVDSESKAGDGFLAEVCQRWEKGFFKGPESIRKVAVRIGIVLGRDGGALDEMLPIFSKGIGGPLGSGKQWMSWIHVDDLVQVLIFAIENEKIKGVINAVSSAPVRNYEFTKALATVLGVPAFLKAPSLALKVALGEMSEVLLSSQRVSCKKLIDHGFKYRFEDIHKALADLVGFMKTGGRIFETAQYIDYPIEQVFKFFSDETNLEQLTPPYLNFHVVKKSTPSLQKGSLIDYKLKIHGVPTTWQTEIVDWQPNIQFIDTQRKGPYSMWHHTHIFKKMGDGTFMMDRVLYKLPMGIWGSFFAGKFVENDVNNIFEYRKSCMSKLFPLKNVSI